MNRKRMLALGVLGGAGEVVQKYTITGAVYEADGETPVEGALIELGAYTAESGADGAYTLAGVPAGTSGSMTCTATGLTFDPIQVTAMTGSLTGQDFIATEPDDV